MTLPWRMEKRTTVLQAEGNQYSSRLTTVNVGATAAHVRNLPQILRPTRPQLAAPTIQNLSRYRPHAPPVHTRRNDVLCETLARYQQRRGRWLQRKTQRKWGHRVLVIRDGTLQSSRLQATNAADSSYGDEYMPKSGVYGSSLVEEPS